jgi:type I restriction enzyme S subunit
MSEWVTSKLSDFADVIGGGTPKTDVSAYWEGNIPWLTPKDLTGYTSIFISKGERNITELGLKESSARMLPSGTVLLTSRAPIGYVAIAANSLCTNQGFKSIIVDDKKANNVFVYYWLKGNTEYLNSLGSGTTFAEISGSVVKDIEILLPPLPEQQAIAEVLSSLDDKIDLLHRNNKTLEQMAETLFRQWFVLEAKEEWEVGTLGDLVTVKRGGSPRPIQDYLADTGLRWLKISDVTNVPSPYIFEIKEHIKEHGINKTVLLKAGSLVVSNSATPGIPKILSVDSCIHDGWLYFPQSKLSNEFLYLFFLKIKTELVSLGNGSIFTNLKTDIVRSFPLVKPDEQTLINFDAIVKPLFDKMYHNAEQLMKLQNLRDTLLPKLMSGQVRVELK